MKILFHSYAFESGWSYQENLLPEACIRAGHEVLCVASDIGVDEKGKMGKISTDNDPVYLRRLPALFSAYIPLSYRIRKLQGFYEVLENFSPDIIFVHALQTLNLADISKYKKSHAEVRIYFNTHTDYYTSGRNVLSKYILHKFLYRKLIQKYLYLAEKVFYIGLNCGMFLWNEYQIPKEMTELMSIGSHVSDSSELDNSRRSVLNELDLNDNSIIFVQAGKLDSKKRIIESIQHFSSTRDKDFVFLIIGEISFDLHDKAFDLINNDHRIRFLGWKTGKELFRYLEAADYYVQPGKGSVIFANAMCCSCAIIAYYLVDYVQFIQDNGWLFHEIKELDKIYDYISRNKGTISEMKMNSKLIADRLLNEDILLYKIR